MDFTDMVTIVSVICVGGLSAVLVGAALYALLILLPRTINNRVDRLKASGRQGRAVILRVPESISDNSHRRSMYTLVTIGLQIDVPGVEIYEVDKTFTFPTGHLSSLEVGKEVAVWIDPKNPRDTSKIVIHVT